MLIDVHTHLDHELFEKDLDKVISRAKEARVKVIITNGINPKTNRQSLEISKKYDIVKCAMGIYPIDALQKEIEEGECPLEDEKIDVDSEIEFIKSNAKDIAAIGEVGMDGKYGELEDQKEVFEKMILLAKELDIPIIVHSRKAEEECIELLEKHKMKKVIMHCFSGKKKLVNRIIENKWYFSIPCNCNRSQHFQKIIELASINKLLTETDAPLMGPVVGERNEPAFVSGTIKKIAEIKGFEVEEVEKNIFLNYQRLF